MIHHPSSRVDRRRGVALLMVLLIVVAITILATGFLARTDAELACGTNTLLHLQMDQLAQSGLEHARGLVLHPQDVPAEFWTNGAQAQQLPGDSRDYYDVNAVPDTSRPLDNCTYEITCEAYRKLADGQKIGRSRLAATLRLDPCIALAAGVDTTLWAGVKVYGDVYSKRALVNNGLIEGDIFATSLAGTGAATGQLNPQTLSLPWPPVTAVYMNPFYHTRILAGGVLSAGLYQPDSIWCCTADASMTGIVQLAGMLLVKGNLTIAGEAGTSRIVAAKNLPALYVGGKLIIGSVNGLQIDGLVVVNGDVQIDPSASNIVVVGGLFVGGTLDPAGLGSTVMIVADPMKAAVVAWDSGMPKSWSPAAGGFYKSIRRH